MASSITIDVSNGLVKTPIFKPGRTTYSGCIHHSRSDGKYQRHELLHNGRGVFYMPKSVNPGDIIEFNSALGRLTGSIVFKVEKAGKNEITGKLYASVDSAKKGGSKVKTPKKPAAPKKEATKKKATKKKAAKKTK